MKQGSPKQEMNTALAQEENLLEWKEVLQKFKKTFGNDIFESWIKNINLKKEFNHYVILSTPTRFVRDWIVSRYADKILDCFFCNLVYFLFLQILQSKIQFSEYFF